MRLPTAQMARTAPRSCPAPPDQRVDEAPADPRRSFLRMVSHELRTPLNSILGFSEVLQSELYGPLGAPQYLEYAGIIHTSGQRLLRLVNQVLEIARLEGGGADLHIGSESVEQALEDAISSLMDEASPRRVTFAIQGQGALPLVMADPRALRNILSNLLQNAVQFSPDGGTIQARARIVGGYVDIVIVDQGPGIDPAEIARLLQPFQQGENALTRRSEGAGLGLPIVRLLCEAMGGRLKLGPASSIGTAARVRLPSA